MGYNNPVGKARSLFALVLVYLVVFPPEAFSQARRQTTVLPFTGGNLSKPELLDLTRVFEESLRRVDSVQVIDQSRREKVLAYLDPGLLTCKDLDCAIKVGRALSAAIVVVGTVVREWDIVNPCGRRPERIPRWRWSRLPHTPFAKHLVM